MINDDNEYIPPSESDITKARKEADKKRAGFSDDDLKKLRIQAKWNLFFLGRGILGYDKFASLHKEVADWIRENWANPYTMLLLPRSHYKSTLDTISDGVQIALPDDLGTCPYPRNLGTNGRQLIAHDIKEMAQLFLFSITKHFTTNPLLIALFPECVPDPRLHIINKSQLELPRESIWNEATFETMGVGSSNQGKHFNLLHLDDIYGEAARDSRTERESHIQWFDNIQSFLITPATDKIKIKGTRWAFDDVYAHAKDVYGEQLKIYRRPVIEDGKPIFPEQFTIDSLEILKKNAKVWNAQYINDPKEGAAKFKPEWKRFYERDGRDVKVTTNASPFSDGNVEVIPYESLDRIILYDPSTSGPFGLTVTGCDRRKRKYILEAVKKSLPVEQQTNLVFSLVVKYQPRIVVCEEVLFSKLFENWWRSEMSLRGIKFRIELCKTKNMEKAIRVEALAQYFEAGEIYFHADQKDLIKEYDEFGATDDYHTLDSLAQGPKYWRAGAVVQPKNSADLLNKFAGRDKFTGY